jgi:hypothetical protein
MRRALASGVYLQTIESIRGARRWLLVGVAGAALLAGLAATLPTGAGVASGWQVIRGAFHAEHAADYSSRGEVSVAPQRPIELAGATQRGAPTP